MDLKVDFIEAVAGGHVLRSIEVRVQLGEQSGYVADCIDLSVVSQGSTVDEALANICEAIELHLADRGPSETAASLDRAARSILQLNTSCSRP